MVAGSQVLRVRFCKLRQIGEIGLKHPEKGITPDLNNKRGSLHVRWDQMKRKETFCMKNIAVIGLGLMGTPISTRLIQAGYSVRGFDIVKRQ